MPDVSRLSVVAAFVIAAAGSGVAWRGPAPALPAGFSEGAPGIKSAGVMTFGPDGVLFMGDSRGGAIYALVLDDRTPDPHTGPVEIASIDKRIAKLLAIPVEDVAIRDMAVHPVTRHVYFSVSRGRTPDAAPALVRATLTGELTEVPLGQAKFARLALADMPAEAAKTPWGASARSMSITDLAYTDGELLIAGLSNEQFSSTLRRARFPFAADAQATRLEVFHTSHGKYETQSPIDTFLPMKVKGQAVLLAGYGCAPIALFDMAALQPSARVRGRTIAELGGGNRPHDMILIGEGERRSVLVANSDRTLMLLAGTDIEKSEALTRRSTRPYESFGTPYLAIAQVGVTQLDNLDAEWVLIVQRDAETGTLDVRSMQKKWLL